MNFICDLSLFILDNSYFGEDTEKFIAVYKANKALYPHTVVPSVNGYAKIQE